MASELITAIVSVLTAVIGIAIIAVLVSKQSTTVSVINSGGSVFDKVLNQAVLGG